ncbi:LOW QUALITY PROTEIN: hypothetical protein M513_09312 [Trichuris suis]|uniref:Uncharacterized protein n=1 Tax=Trichuris suis TaxID=68888 RepID=A0A085LXZ9_9BILA|nr:LOW QUALITY PROTEIN: hypothetical protein M513_09312 [Trichuris suis]
MHPTTPYLGPGCPKPPLMKESIRTAGQELPGPAVWFTDSLCNCTSYCYPTYRGLIEAPFAGKVFDVKLIPEFDGSSQPVLEWLEKLELVCELCGIVDIARVLPLRLTGGALAVYQQLANEDRKDVGRIKEALTAAFAVDRFAAHRQFASRRLNMGESPDVFLADLRRLGTLAGGVSESFLGCAFVAGLPEYVQDLLRAGARMEELTLNQLVARARAVMVNEISTCEKNDGLAAGAAEASLRTASRKPAIQCYACGGASHFARECPTRNSVRTSARPGKKVNAYRRGCLRRPPPASNQGAADCADEGRRRTTPRAGTHRIHQVHHLCSLLLILAEATDSCNHGQWRATTLHRRSVKLQLSEGDPVTIEGVIADKKPLGFDVIIGMNGISALGGVTMNAQGQVQFGRAKAVVVASAAASIRVDEKDFVATYDPATNTWTTAWKWANGAAPEVLRNTKEEFPLPEGIREAYTEELEQWIQNGWLIPYDESKFGPAKALIPLMAVIQRSKGKVRPVMDFRELNSYIDTYTAKSDVCAQMLREWRRQGVNVCILDLRKAYLQVCVDRTLWPYQTVVVKDRRYCLTRLGFGLNVAPMIMKAVISRVLSLDPDIQKGTSAYIDDIFVNENVVSANHVIQHLAKYGLSCKVPERVADGARVLGLNVRGQQGTLVWSRGNETGEPPKPLTRRTVFAYCGALVGHYPVCGWLRPATAFIKREANRVTSRWDEPILDEQVQEHLREIAARLKVHDPAQGRWDVASTKVRLWVDASALALGVVLEVNGAVIEDAAWLRSEDTQHINMAELDAAIKGLNLGLSWQMKDIELMTDSLTVHRWLNDSLSGRTRLKTKAASEMLIRRRMATILALVEEYNLNLEIHCTSGHPENALTLYFAKRRDPTVSKKCVSRVVSNCHICRSIDPVPARKPRGGEDMAEGQYRCHTISRKSLLDTHYCGPSRFAIWRPLKYHTSVDVCEQLETIFCERGAPDPDELLADNDTAFRSQIFSKLVERWNLRLRFRCAYAPSGNGIIERCHRSVEGDCGQEGSAVCEAVYWYNLMPRDDCSEATAPANAIYRYPVRVRGVDSVVHEVQDVRSPYVVGDEVWIKQPGRKCYSQFGRGIAVEVDGTPRPIKDIRRQTTLHPERQSGAETCRHESEEEMSLYLPERNQVIDSERATSPATSSPPQEEGPDTSQALEPQETGPRRSKRTRRSRHCYVCD